MLIIIGTMTEVGKCRMFANGNHILANAAVWSPDGQWIVYDVRGDPAGSLFDGDRIERIHIRTRDVQLLHQSTRGAKCGVVTYSPVEDKVVFILGPEHPTPDYHYGPSRRRGVIVDAARPGAIVSLDARNLLPPFTPGALRGGSHVHVFSPDGALIGFTYNDDIIFPEQRNVGVAIPHHPVRVPSAHPRNHDGDYFCVLVTKTAAHPGPGSDDIRRAFEDAWIGTNGYLRPDGTRQTRAIAFQGEVIAANGQAISEVFIVDLPDDLTRPGDGPLEGTLYDLPAPPRGVVQRRLTFTQARKYPGLSAPRHWLRSSPDGSRIAFLMRDERGISQLWTVSPNGGGPSQLSHHPHPIGSAFTWSPDGRLIAHVMDHSLFLTHTDTGESRRLTPPGHPRPEAAVFSPDGSKIAYLEAVRWQNHIGVVELPQ